MYLSTEKVFSLFVLASPGKIFPVQQSPLPLESNSDIGRFQDNGLIRDVEYGYKGPGVYHISGSSDLFNLVPDQIGSGDGAPVVVWYVHTYSGLSRITMLRTGRFDENWRQSNNTNSQRWFISDVGNGFVTVANNDTGVLLSASSSKPFIFYYSFWSKGCSYQHRIILLSWNEWDISNSIQLQTKHLPALISHHPGS